MQLIKEFVRQRGGGLMMLAGEEDYKNGKYDRSPIGDVLPVYCDEVEYPAEESFHMVLSREGWLEPSLRLRPEESLENQRLNGMPSFDFINPVRASSPAPRCWRGRPWPTACRRRRWSSSISATGGPWRVAGRSVAVGIAPAQ